jgi:large subunit ribosomal protein L4
MFRVGIRSILSELLRQGRLVVSDSIVPATPKTKAFSEKLKNVDARRVLIIVDKVEANLVLASRNIPNVEVIEAENLSPVLLVAADKVVATSAAIKKLEERLA